MNLTKFANSIVVTLLDDALGMAFVECDDSAESEGYLSDQLAVATPCKALRREMHCVTGGDHRTTSSSKKQMPYSHFTDNRQSMKHPETEKIPTLIPVTSAAACTPKRKPHSEDSGPKCRRGWYLRIQVATTTSKTCTQFDNLDTQEKDFGEYHRCRHGRDGKVNINQHDGQ